MKALITGASGFIGGHLLSRLTSEGWDVVIARRGGTTGGVEQLLSCLESAKPDVVFHMAGLTRAVEAADLYEANVALSTRLLDAAACLARPPVIVLAGSAAEYGQVAPENVPVVETHPCRPATDYAVSKYAQTLMALLRAKAGVKVIVARIWNPVGPGMPPHLALASFAAQIAAIPPSGGELRVGNLEVERDFIDVREVARLLAALGCHRQAVGQVINICSGRSWRLRQLVETMINIDGRAISVVPDPARMRAGETKILYGDTTRLAELGLAPALPDFDTLLPAILSAARGTLR